MNIAVLSDIHGNHIALETCMEYLEKQDIDAYCFLGDYVGEFPGIRQVMDTLYDLQKRKPCYIIKGNKEDYQLSGLGEGHPEWDAYPSTVGMIRYGNQQLSQEDMAFLSSLPITDCIRIDGMEDIRICHGSPRNVREDIREGRSVNKEILAEVGERYIVSGHTHKVMNIEVYSKVVWNPGSVGLSLNENGAAKTYFMILHSDNREWKPEFVALEYDVRRTIEEMWEKGLYEIAPFWTLGTERILTGGTVTLGKMLRRAMELCERAAGKCIWPEIPEIYWKRAHEELFGGSESIWNREHMK
ncbi:MAG: metallophosphoesterase family protein [Lachnospiraceae bacterium]|nr:metallophosphoesterase family protein [Lachnospiraceae bacterium]